MDLDYQSIKDVDILKRDDWNGLMQKPLPRQNTTRDSSSRQIPPVKPRRSLKYAKTQRENTGQLLPTDLNQEKQVVVKKMPPALSLGGPVALSPLSAGLRAHTMLWFQRTQLPRLQLPGQPLPRWLHGFATRREAEDLLKSKPQGCFLLRLSESKIGFVLSYRGEDRCRHFIIEEEGRTKEGSGGHYLITGEESRHRSLQELINYYSQNPVGPFPETLTNPCHESNGAFAKAITPTVQDEDGGDLKQTPKQNVLTQSSTKPSTLDQDWKSTTQSPPSDHSTMAEYAVVKKVLKKSCSLPENQLAELLTPAKVEVPNSNDDSPEPAKHWAEACGQGQPSNAPYARVNKPPRAEARVNESPYVNVSTLADIQVETNSRARVTQHDSAGDPDYWHLEPQHTYEEAPLVKLRDAQEAPIDFYARGQWREAERSTAQSQNHLYSEVNLRNIREVSGHTPMPGRAVSALPTRPLPKAINASSRPDLSFQRGVEPILMSSSPSRPGAFQTFPSEFPLSDGPGRSIYEQIQDRSSGERPPLPPPNVKRDFPAKDL